MSANRTTQVGYNWVNQTLGIPSQRVREDRIIDEIRATAGDLRQVADMSASNPQHAALCRNAQPPDLSKKSPSG